MVRSLSGAWSIEVCYCSVLDQCWVGGINIIGQREFEHCDDVPASSF